METSKEKKEMLAIRKELESVLGRILINESLEFEFEPAFIELLPENHMIIDPAPVTEIGGCHAKEIGQVEGIRKYMAIRRGMILKTLKPSRTSTAKFAAGVADTAFKKNDATLSKLAQKLADCTCSCGQLVDPV